MMSSDFVDVPPHVATCPITGTTLYIDVLEVDAEGKAVTWGTYGVISSHDLWGVD